MTIDVLTLFPKMFDGFLSESMIKRARDSKKIVIRIHNIRGYTLDKHRKVDDRPFGGGCGMVLRCQPVLDALSAVKKVSKGAKTILMAPQGRPLKHDVAQRLSKDKALILIAGHYEGLDERISSFVDETISIGDYVLTGGEIPAMVLIDAIARFIPGVLGDESSAVSESFAKGLLEYPQYTRPADYNGDRVPDVLISGNHDTIKRWRRLESIRKTMEMRPDLIRHISQLDIKE